MKRLRLAAAYEIVAGLIGLGNVIGFHQLSNGRAITYNVFALALASTSIVLGILLWIGSPSARRLSLGFQAVQIPRLTSSAFIFGVLVGVEGTVRFEGPLISLFTTNGVLLYALRPSAAQPTVVGLNLVAVLVAGLLYRPARKPAVEDHERLASTVASSGKPMSKE